MIKMSNREIAAAVWLTIFLVYVLAHDKSGDVRRSLVHLLQAFFVRHIMLFMLWAVLWIILCVRALIWAGIWRIDNLKTTVLWAVPFAFVTLFDARRVTEEKTYFSETIRDAVGATVFITFIAELYSFSLPVELLLTPLFTFVGGIMIVSEGKPEYASVHKATLGASIIGGLLLLGHSLYEAVGDLKGFASLANLREFCIPIVLSLAFLPYLYIVSVLMFYENTITGSAWILKDPSLRRYALWQTILRFRLDFEGLRRWKRDLGIFRPENRADIRKIIAEVKARQKKEKYPSIIPAEQGWSPYQATMFLSGLNLGTSDYHPIATGEWWASSPILKLDDGILANNLAYYIEGDENAAKRLTLRLHVNDRGRGETADARFVQACEALLVAAIQPAASQELLCEKGQTDTVIKGRHVRMQSEDFANPERGYSRTLYIDHTRSGIA